MPLNLAGVLARLGEGYLLVGLLFGIWFAARGAGRLDFAATTGSAGFRLLILPGGVLLWPLLLPRFFARAAR